MFIFLSAWVDRKDLFMRATCSLLPDGTFWCVPEYGVDKDYLKIISEKLRFAFHTTFRVRTLMGRKFHVFSHLLPKLVKVYSKKFPKI